MAAAEMSGAVARLPLLPATMCGIAALLAVKSAGLIADAYGAAEAPAAGTPAAATPAVATPAVATPTAAAPAAAPPGAVAVPATGAAGSTAPDAAAKMPGKEEASAPTEPPLPSPAERALLMDLRKRRIELDARAAALEQHEAVLKAAEKQLATRVDQLTSLQTRLEALEAARRDRDEASWRGLVRVYETMKPKDAAVIFNDLDSPVLLQVVDRMKDGKAAAIMAVMAPERARKLTDDLAMLRSRANSPPEAPPGTPPGGNAGPVRPASAVIPATSAPSAPLPGASQ